MANPILIGPIHQLLSMQGLPDRGPIKDERLSVQHNMGCLIGEGKIIAIDGYGALIKKYDTNAIEHFYLKENYVALPGFIDAHTHICYAGSRAGDYALRNSGSSYLEIAAAGGGIWSTVLQTRMASEASLALLTAQRANEMLMQGITTIEVKSGYGLSVQEELKMLCAINQASTKADLIPTCLAAHTLPKEYNQNRQAYIQLITEELLPLIHKENLCKRVDAFIEQSAFNTVELEPYFAKAKSLGFDITIHADQFTTGGSEAAVNVGAISADHLEASTDKEIAMLAQSNTIPIVLPGASLGLGMAFAPARKLLDAGCSLVIASDYNPGSAPMGQLLMQAAVLGAYEKLSNAEVLAGITCRAANALGLNNRGVLQENCLADLLLFHSDDYREITYQQGRLQPEMVWKGGELVKGDLTPSPSPKERGA